MKKKLYLIINDGLNKHDHHRMARIMAMAEEVFGSPAAAAVWLSEKNPVLGDTTPSSLLNTDEGAQRVIELLGRIEHGIYS